MTLCLILELDWFGWDWATIVT